MDNSSIVSDALNLLVEHYIFPERARAIATHVTDLTQARRYDNLDELALCRTVTQDIQEVHRDPHVSLRFHRAPRTTEPWEDDQAAKWRRRQLTQAGGIRRIEVRDDGIGVIETTLVGEPEICGDYYAAAMRLVAHTDGLIIDLRRNIGGSPDGAALLCSYFFDTKPVHLNDIHDRNSRRQMWTYPHLAGPRYLDRPVYALIGDQTFSGAEDVAYTLSAHGRAITVGQPTSGGAHPTKEHHITDHIGVTVPYARTISTVTGDNWEGTGVLPDVECPADATFEYAHRHCIDAAAASSTMPSGGGPRPPEPSTPE